METKELKGVSLHFNRNSKQPAATAGCGETPVDQLSNDELVRRVYRDYAHDPLVMLLAQRYEQSIELLEAIGEAEAA